MWPASEETQELLVSARAGDAQAASALFERHRAALRRLVALRLDRAIQGRIDASDVVQDALVEAHRRWPEFLAGSPLPFHLWLRQIARDRLIDAHRRHHVSAKRSVAREQHQPAVAPDMSAFDLLGQLEDARELTPAAAILRQELQARFRAALTQLNDESREVIEMRHIEQLSNQETAQALGLSEAAAGMRYLRALRRLRTLLEEAPSTAGLP